MWPLISARLRRSAEITWLLVAPNLGADPVHFLWQMRHNTVNAPALPVLASLLEEIFAAFNSDAAFAHRGAATIAVSAMRDRLLLSPILAAH